jgi:MFS family permease
MRKSQILSLFVCSFVVYTTGNGLIPLLPIYATQLGADSAAVGYYLAFSYIAVAAGAVSAGWVSDKFQRRKKPIIITGLAGIPVAWLMGRAGNIWSLSIATACLWFCLGLGLALTGILTGLSAGEDERGKIFGILSLTTGLGAVVGGLTTGFIVDQWDFPTMFAVVAAFFILLPLSGLFLKEKGVERTKEGDGPAKGKSGLGRNFYLLFCASLIASIAGFVILLVRSLMMMPLPLLMGWLSDRMGRKIFLYLGYLAGIISLTILVVSVSLWHFMIALALQAIIQGVNTSIGNAWVTDLVPQELLGRGLALYGATTWIGGVIGFAGGGYALQNLGTSPTLIIGICLPLIAMVILIPIRSGVGWRVATIR